MLLLKVIILPLKKPSHWPWRSHHIALEEVIMLPLETVSAVLWVALALMAVFCEEGLLCSSLDLNCFAKPWNFEVLLLTSCLIFVLPPGQGEIMMFGIKWNVKHTWPVLIYWELTRIDMEFAKVCVWVLLYFFRENEENLMLKSNKMQCHTYM